MSKVSARGHFPIGPDLGLGHHGPPAQVGEIFSMVLLLLLLPEFQTDDIQLGESTDITATSLFSFLPLISLFSLIAWLSELRAHLVERLSCC